MDIKKYVINNVPHSIVLSAEHEYMDATIKLRADKGYKFVKSTVKATYMTEMGYPDTQDFYLRENDTLAVADFSFIDPKTEYTVRGETIATAPPPPTEPTIINNVSNTTEQHTWTNNVLTIGVTSANQPKKRLKDVQVTYKSTSGETITVPLNIEYSEGVSRATITLTNVDINTNVVINGSFVWVTLIEYNLSNCIINPPLKEYYFEGDTINITITANEGDEFTTENVPRLTYTNADGYLETKNFTINDNKTATLVFIVPTDVTEITITATATPVHIVGADYGLINVYKIDISDLSELAEKRFFKEYSKDPVTGATLYQEVDLGEFIHSVKKIYIDIPTSADEVIRCGNYNTGISVKQPKDIEHVLDLGTCDVPYINDNTFDYSNTISLFLPLLGFNSLDSTYIGKTIKLSLKLNILSGKGVYIITCDEIDDLFFEVDLSSDIYFKTSSQERVGGGVIDDNLYLMGFSPYIVYTYKDEVKPQVATEDRRFNNSFGIVQIKDIKGEIKGDLLSNKFKPKGMTTEEYTELKRLINEGVIYE